MSYLDFSFPLNVYAHAIHLEEGQVDYLHYGLFASPAESLRAAQLHSCELLLARLPPPPCRILEVGIGLGTLLATLHQRGYEVHGITPDAAQIAIARNKSEARLSLTRLEDFHAPAGSFDLVLFQESSQYIDPLALFERAFELLTPSGQLIILDETAFKRTAPGHENLHLQPVMLELAPRFGFTLQECLDLSSRAAPTLDYLLRVIEHHRHTLITDLGCTDEQLDALNESNRRYREKYSDGRFGYSLLRFQRQQLPRWQLAAGGPARRDDMRALFQEVFGEEMSPALWHWKYDHTRLPPVIASPLDADGRRGPVQVHYGGLTRPMLFHGEVHQAVQIVDVMVHPSQRGILTRHGAFAQVAATFFDVNVGYGNDCLASFGFPNERAMRLGRTLGLYEEVDRMVEVIWPTLGGSNWLLRGQALGSDDLSAALVERAWAAMRDDLRGSIVGVRNWHYIHHRYLEHPTRRYQLLAVHNRLGGALLGVIVLRCDGGEAELMDIIAPRAAISGLLRYARRWLGSQGIGRLYGWIAASFVHCFTADTNDAEVKDIGISIATNHARFGPPLEQLAGQWWLQSGDSDFK